MDKWGNGSVIILSQKQKKRTKNLTTELQTFKKPNIDIKLHVSSTVDASQFVVKYRTDVSAYIKKKIAFWGMPTKELLMDLVCCATLV